jgi:hypothetical protein
MRSIGFWLISILLCINFAPMLVQAQEQNPKVSLNCSLPPAIPFDNTYGIGMDYHTPIECEIDNPSSYTIEIEISWAWQWNANLIDSEGESMDETQQMNPNGNLFVYIQTNSPEYQKIGDYEIQINVIVTRYGLGQDAMYDCSGCEEESTSEIITIHPFYDYSNVLIDSSEWNSEDWTYLVQDEYFYSEGPQFPDCPNDVYWKEYEISILANHDGRFAIDKERSQPYQAWLLDSNGNKSNKFSEIEYLTGESLIFRIHIEWDMNEINESLLSKSILPYYPYSVYLWWGSEAFMDDTKYSNIKTYNPNYQLYEFSDSYIWQSRDTDYSLLEMDTMPCFIGEIVEYDDSIIIIEDDGDYQLSSPSMISTIMVISVCALSFRRNGLGN